MWTFIGLLSIAASITVTGAIITHFIFTLCMSFTQQLQIWHILNSFLSHFAIFVDYPPISTLYTNISSPQVLMASSSQKLRSNHLTKMIILLSLSSPEMSWIWVVSSFLPNGGVCEFICSGVQSSRLPQFDLLSPGFQFIWLKISLPNTSRFICSLYRSPKLTNHKLLFDHLSKSTDTITLQSPRSEIMIFSDFNDQNPAFFTFH